MSFKRSGADSGAESSWKSSLDKALRAGSDWPDKDELLDVLYWGRQILSLLMGIIFGMIPLYGFFSVVVYVATSTLIGHHFVVNYQKVDEDSVGGFWEIAKEGFGTAFAAFLVAWITVHSALHFE